ncbi:MAG: hypothetical protein JWR55_3523 [Aeromicrobium sp.]|nr:hypothetical protein [Aeromicrobium sp.]
MLVLLLGGCAGASPAGSATAGSATAERPAGTVAEACADLVVIGARGSTQNPDLNAGVGTEVRRTVEQLTDLVHARSDRTVHVEAIRYDASGAPTLAAYLARTAKGTRQLTDRLSALAGDCPDSRFALLGFSQGAQVVHGAAADMAPALAARVSLVAMIADPLTNPADPIRHWSYAKKPTGGNGRLGSGPPVDDDLREVAISLCVAGDEICNDRGAPGGPPSDTHKHFYEKPATTRATARQLDAILAAHGA